MILCDRLCVFLDCVCMCVLVYFSGPKRHLYNIPPRLFWNKLPCFHYLYNSLLYTKHTTISHSTFTSRKTPWQHLRIFCQNHLLLLGLALPHIRCCCCAFFYTQSFAVLMLSCNWAGLAAEYLAVEYLALGTFYQFPFLKHCCFGVFFFHISRYLDCIPAPKMSQSCGIKQSALFLFFCCWDTALEMYSVKHGY